MARHTSNHERPQKAQIVTATKPSTHTWTNLAELKEAAIRNGCTPAQLQNALESVGDNPVRIASYLKRQAFVPSSFGTMMRETD